MFLVMCASFIADHALKFKELVFRKTLLIGFCATNFWQFFFLCNLLDYCCLCLCSRVWLSLKGFLSHYRICFDVIRRSWYDAPSFVRRRRLDKLTVNIDSLLIQDCVQSSLRCLRTVSPSYASSIAGGAEYADCDGINLGKGDWDIGLAEGELMIQETFIFGFVLVRDRKFWLIAVPCDREKGNF